MRQRDAAPKNQCSAIGRGACGQVDDATDASVKRKGITHRRTDKTKTSETSPGRRAVPRRETRGLAPVEFERDAPEHIDAVEPKESKSMTTRKGRLVPRSDSRRR